MRFFLSEFFGFNLFSASGEFLFLCGRRVEKQTEKSGNRSDAVADMQKEKQRRKQQKNRMFLFSGRIAATLITTEASRYSPKNSVGNTQETKDNANAATMPRTKANGTR